MQAGASGCKRVQAGASRCKRVQAGASGCKPVQAGASGCKRVRAGASGCKPVQAGASGCEPVPAGARGCEAVQAGASMQRLQRLTTTCTAAAACTCCEHAIPSRHAACTICKQGARIYPIRGGVHRRSVPAFEMLKRHTTLVYSCIAMRARVCSWNMQPALRTSRPGGVYHSTQDRVGEVYGDIR